MYNWQSHKEFITNLKPTMRQLIIELLTFLFVFYSQQRTILFLG